MWWGRIQRDGQFTHFSFTNSGTPLLCQDSFAVIGQWWQDSGERGESREEARDRSLIRSFHGEQSFNTLHACWELIHWFPLSASFNTPAPTQTPAGMRDHWWSRLCSVHKMTGAVKKKKGWKPNKSVLPTKMKPSYILNLKTKKTNYVGKKNFYNP